MIGTLSAECLVAVTGIFPGRAPSDTQRRLATRFPHRLANRIKGFLEAEKPAKFKAPTLPKEQKALHEQILEKIDPEEVAGWFAPKEAELATHYGLLLQAARDKILTAWATYPDPSLGIHNFDLAPDELLDVVHVFRTLDEVESVFDDLDACVLLPDQIGTIAQLYPDLYETLKQAAFDALVPYLEAPGNEETKKNLSPLKEEQIRILMQLAPDIPIETAAAAQPAALPAAMKPGRRPPEPKTTDQQASQETPTEHIAARRVST